MKKNNRDLHQRPLVGIEELAAMLGLSPRTVFKMKQSGQLPKAIRIGRSVRWRRADLRRWLANL